MLKRSLLITIIGVFLLFTSNISQGAETLKNSKINATAATKKIEAGTILKVKLQEPIGTAHLMEGAPFTVTVVDDIKEGKKIVVPQGTLIRGSLDYVSKAKHFSKGAVLGMYFDHIVSPSGKQIPLDLALCNKIYKSHNTAEEVVKEVPTGVVLASQDEKLIMEVKNSIQASWFRCSLSQEVV